jgi:hypothetical protein
MVKENDDGRWSYNDVVLWLRRRKNGDMFERWREQPMLR